MSARPEVLNEKLHYICVNDASVSPMHARAQSCRSHPALLRIVGSALVVCQSIGGFALFKNNLVCTRTQHTTHTSDNTHNTHNTQHTLSHLLLVPVSYFYSLCYFFGSSSSRSTTRPCRCRGDRPGRQIALTWWIVVAAGRCSGSIGLRNSTADARG
jgi:hypothetical protein